MSRRYSLSRKEGWRQYVDDPPRERPHRLTRKEIAGLGEQARQEYHELRAEWHANLPIVRTPQLDATHGTLDEIVSSNRHDGERVRRVAAIDALPGLGKSTIANSFARAFDREQIRRHGSLTNDGNERIPVVWVGLSANTTLRSLNQRICEFYGHPAARRRSSNAEHLAAFALDCILRAQRESMTPGSGVSVGLRV
ncbi:MAG TPA: hypothetical protein VGS97_07495 [Actinocrinis sp.]|uniref:hypothetical protein n=1 Tax=Actinocrinis sp. TaxID=1920516 RepID=UPI002DDCE4E5|nr:hypothetical protein [Actinocrinis sp.]HEV2343920.1 hypothetical protein [Actinocrinis sp.]